MPRIGAVTNSSFDHTIGRNGGVTAKINPSQGSSPHSDTTRLAIYNPATITPDTTNAQTATTLLTFNKYISSFADQIMANIAHDPKFTEFQQKTGLTISDIAISALKIILFKDKEELAKAIVILDSDNPGSPLPTEMLVLMMKNGYLNLDIFELFFARLEPSEQLNKVLTRNIAQHREQLERQGIHKDEVDIDEAVKATGIGTWNNYGHVLKEGIMHGLVSRDTLHLHLDKLSVNGEHNLLGECVREAVTAGLITDKEKLESYLVKLSAVETPLPLSEEGNGHYRKNYFPFVCHYIRVVAAANGVQYDVKPDVNKLFGYEGIESPKDYGELLGKLVEAKAITQGEFAFHFQKLRKMFDLVLTSRYSITQILNIAEEWGFITKKVKKVGGKPLTRGTLYGMLVNPFYAGWFLHKGEMIKGNHKPMITLQEFDRVQEILGRKGRPRPKKRYFPFSGGIIRCGECLSAISTEIKKEAYVYYHCISKGEANCSQRNRKWIKAEKLEAQIKREIDRITILPEFREWALARIKEYYNQEIEDRDNVYETQHKTMVSCQKQLDKLVDMKLNDQIADEQYNEKRNALLKQIDNLKDKLDNTHERVEDELRIVERAVNFATRAHASFIKGNYETKKKILIGLGQVGISQNFSLKDGILRIERNPVLEPIKIDYPEYQEQYYKLELHKTPPELRTNEQNEGAAKLCSAWSSTLDKVRTQVILFGDKETVAKLR